MVVINVKACLKFDTFLLKFHFQTTNKELKALKNKGNLANENNRAIKTKMGNGKGSRKN